ncbi:isopenicillin N synthase family dioxygenase [Nocardia mangyaensis]|uniref:isopenicillin N synthase family dioxygenase n=1 Tax=Nocardia mangyaensis TaxID=2213200 RepID=UPI0026750A79|nr:2-oxoglutarate and iron-dependent oxygenase domain-containing protein [Nocardia mangyaensis]MDO3650144.1 2-oxoglutarate and iron-dependent oxygenase domain-containing protein [Nocardia mangyaensis]
MTASYDLSEISREKQMGGLGRETDDREIRVIDLTDFDTRRTEITDQLWAAATEIGFFQLSGHGIPQELIDGMFGATADFFALPDDVKGQYPLVKKNNAGWESLSQVRPSIGVPDQKESYQVTRPHMDQLWPSEAELAGFRSRVLDFEHRAWAVAMRVLSCFADRLGLPREHFTAAHDPESPNYQSALRLLHYFAVPEELRGVPGRWRAGAHTDFDCLTLLFQRDGQGGLQVCPGKEMEDQEWTSITPSSSLITCNIGDMLTRWSDDLLPSNFHRVRSPGEGEYQGERYSIAYFAQADRDAIIQGPAGKYPPVTAADFLTQRVQANYQPRG